MTYRERTPVTAIAALLDSALPLVDVGGRGSALPPLTMLAPFAHYVSCEPDPAAAERLREDLPKGAPWRAITVVPEAIAAQNGPVTLNLTAKPGMSSLLKPNPSVTQRFFGRQMDVVTTELVPAITLSEAARRYHFEDACFIKLDTQGTELDILQSGDALVRDTVLGVYVEVSFQPFYEGQCLFADVDSYLRSCGLSLVGMNRTLFRLTSHRTDLYSRRTAVWAHCLYFRDPGLLMQRHSDEKKRRDVLRLLLLTLAFKYFDLTLELVEAAARAEMFPQVTWEAAAREVEDFVRDQTRRIVKKAKLALANETPAEDPGVALLARALRDKRYLD